MISRPRTLIPCVSLVTGCDSSVPCHSQAGLSSHCLILPPRVDNVSVTQFLSKCLRYGGGRGTQAPAGSELASRFGDRRTDPESGERKGSIGRLTGSDKNSSPSNLWGHWTIPDRADRTKEGLWVGGLHYDLHMSHDDFPFSGQYRAFPGSKRTHAGREDLDAGRAYGRITGAHKLSLCVPYNTYNKSSVHLVR